MRCLLAKEAPPRHVIVKQGSQGVPQGHLEEEPRAGKGEGEANARGAHAGAAATSEDCKYLDSTPQVVAPAGSKCLDEDGCRNGSSSNLRRSPKKRSGASAIGRESCFDRIIAFLGDLEHTSRHAKRRCY